jgi:hypothetical protein
MTTLDPIHGHPVPTAGERHVWLAWIRDLAIGIVMLLAFLVVAAAGFYVRARLGLPS